VDPEAVIARCSVAEQQRVEILKALYRGARILILDEPTAVLAPQEASQLLDAVRALARSGVSVILITH
jgi:simple sugar transport system ATP-binding protein